VCSRRQWWVSYGGRNRHSAPSRSWHCDTAHGCARVCVRVCWDGGEGRGVSFCPADGTRATHMQPCIVHWCVRVPPLQHAGCRRTQPPRGPPCSHPIPEHARARAPAHIRTHAHTFCPGGSLVSKYSHRTISWRRISSISSFSHCACDFSGSKSPHRSNSPLAYLRTHAHARDGGSGFAACSRSQCGLALRMYNSFLPMNAVRLHVPCGG